MVETERTWFGNRGLICFGRGDTKIVSIAKDIEVTVTGEYEELYGIGSTKRQDAATHTKKVTVRFTVMKFDPASTDLWYIINPKSASAPVGMSDSSNVGLFDVDVYLDRDVTDDVKNVKLAVEDVYFESLPFSISENEWIGIELEGVGTDITISNTAYGTETNGDGDSD